MTGDHDAIVAARDIWGDALVGWHVQLHDRRGTEDLEHAEKLSRRLEESARLHPGDVFPSRPRRRAQELVRASREREREESIRRAGGAGSVWARWPQGR
jgi:hypothetical protein